MKKSGCAELGVEVARWELFSKVQLSVEYPSDSVYYKTVIKYECVGRKEREIINSGAKNSCIIV